MPIKFKRWFDGFRAANRLIEDYGVDTVSVEGVDVPVKRIPDADLITLYGCECASESSLYSKSQYEACYAAREALKREILRRMNANS